MRIASYNVENLFDLQRNGSEYVEYIPNTSWKWNRKNYKLKLENIAKVIVDVNADVIALQEIESTQALKDLRAMLKTKGLYYRYYAIATAKKTTVRVALLSKYPLNGSRAVTISNSRAYRSILETKIWFGSTPLHVFTNHWKAKSGPESRRIVSAKALRKRVAQIGYDKNIILLGDFNSHYKEFEIFKKNQKHNDTGGLTGINHILKTTLDQEMVSLKDLKSCEDCFYNLWNDLREEERFSYRYRGTGEALDNILISSALNDGKKIEYKKGSFNKLTSPYLFKKKNIYRWQKSKNYPKHHLGKGYSDHLPIYADFKIL